jgi:hypothetical protein
MAPWQERISAVLEAEIAFRARRLVAAGPRTAFTGLHQTVRWEDDTLVVHPTGKAAALRPHRRGVHARPCLLSGRCPGNPARPG